MIRMKLAFYLFVITISLTAFQDKKSAKSVIDAFEKWVSAQQSWEYDIHYKMKYFSSDDDTLNYHSNIRLIRVPEDSIFGGIVWIKNDTTNWYYDLEHIYLIQHQIKEIRRYFPHKGQDYAIRGNTISGVINSYFLKPIGLSKNFSDSTISVSILDSTIKSKNYQVVSFNYPDNEYFTNAKKTFFFDAQYMLKHIIYSVQSQNEWQYNEWHFKNEKYNQLTKEALKSEFDDLLKTYTVVDHKPRTAEDYKLIDIGEKIPSFTGFHFQTGDSVKLEDYKNKYVILDFWYKDCFPCIKAIPFLSSLKDKYPKDELAILGLNPIDHSDKNRKKLPDFIEINKMNYPAILVDRIVAKEYKVTAYPTFYIIDKEGKVLFSKIGYAEENEQAIDSLLSTIFK